ncbi:putative reverse transcriptase domain-containing protein [Tanacetum coccineum]
MSPSRPSTLNELYYCSIFDGAHRIFKARDVKELPKVTKDSGKGNKSKVEESITVTTSENQNNTTIAAQPWVNSTRREVVCRILEYDFTGVDTGYKFLSGHRGTIGKEFHVDPTKIKALRNRFYTFTPTEKNKKYEWGEEEEAAFQILKQKLYSAPILALPEGSEDFVVYYDASIKGFGSVLMQREKVIAYASTSNERSLNRII